jgi:two-component system response regulator RegX3
MTKILIVEDESSFSEALAFLLGKEGFEVSVAEDGRADEPANNSLALYR